jgi:hypothetical protein
MYDTFGYWHNLKFRPAGPPEEQLAALLELLREGQIDGITHQQLRAMVADLVRYFLIETDADSQTRKNLAELTIRALLPGDLYADPTSIFLSPETRGRKTKEGKKADSLMIKALNVERKFIEQNGIRITEWALHKQMKVTRGTVQAWRADPAYQGVVDYLYHISLIRTRAPIGAARWT